MEQSTKIHQITLPTPFAVGDVHVYVLKGDTLTLIDAGVKTTEAREALKSGLRRIGYSLKDIEQVALTHHHPDHIGLIEELPRIESITADEAVDPWLRRDETYLQHYERFFEEVFVRSGIPGEYHSMLETLRSPIQFAAEGEVTTPLCEGDKLPGHPEWKVVETKGHAQSHVSFLNESEQLLIGGDHLLYHISPNPLIEPSRYQGGKRPKPLLQFRNNMFKCQQLGIKTVYPGHGPCFSNINDTIKQQLKHQEDRAFRVLDLLKHKPQTPFEICRKIFPRQYDKQLNLTMSETIGQLDYLEDRGLIESSCIQDQLVYHSIKDT